MKSSLRGLLAVNIAKDFICPHNFIVYIDKNLSIRDYFIADFQIELPKITPEEISSAEEIPSKDIVDIDLIKLNVPATQLTYILKSIFLKQKIVLIFDQEYIYNHIYNFFKYISQSAFETNITLITEAKYKDDKNNYQDSMVFDNINILRNVKNLINPKKLIVEKQIVNRFIAESKLGYSYIILKNDIRKAFQLSTAIVDFSKGTKQNERINILKINTQLEEAYKIKIDTTYLNFLIDICKNYYGVTIPSITDSFLGI